MRVASWSAGALALGWIAVAVGALVYPAGHPPAWFVIGEGVVMASFVVAPIGAAAAMISAWRARRHSTGVSRRTLTALAMNVVFLLVAAGLWLWLMSVTSPSAS
jgi:hypothetical protein